MSSPETHKTWRFLSNHTQVLLYLRRDPDARFRDIAQHVGITERAAQRIVSDLIESGYLESERVGRRNRYRLNTEIAMRHPAQDGHDIGELLQLLQLRPDDRADGA
jgi:DNA-binding IclR family transcriptional regulator